MGKTRKGELPSAQIAEMGVIDISSRDFSLDGGPFNIKNDLGTEVELEVYLYSDKKEAHPIITKFYPGWNPEIVRRVKQSPSVTNLFWGN